MKLTYLIQPKSLLISLWVLATVIYSFRQFPSRQHYKSSSNILQASNSKDADLKVAVILLAVSVIQICMTFF